MKNLNITINTHFKYSHGSATYVDRSNDKKQNPFTGNWRNNKHNCTCHLWINKNVEFVNVFAFSVFQCNKKQYYGNGLCSSITASVL